jgi:beta-galactosidase
MDRRNFLKTTGTLIAAASVAPALPAAGLAPTEAAQAGGRMILPINRNWRFSPSATAAAHERDFDDSQFAQVVVPHTNLREPWHSFDEKSYEFVSTYRRRFRLPASARGRRVFVDFEGVMTASTVWLNGQRIGEYKGGFTPFSFELTAHVDFDRDNVLGCRSRLERAARHSSLRIRGRLPDLRRHLSRSVLRIVAPTYIENIFAQPKEVLSGKPSLDVQCFLAERAARRRRRACEPGGRALRRRAPGRTRPRRKSSPVATRSHPPEPL